MNVERLHEILDDRVELGLGDLQRHIEAGDWRLTLRTNWIESAGGPLVVIPEFKRATWRGGTSSDYDEACEIESYIGVLRRDWGELLVLGDEPLSTAVIRRAGGPSIVRWQYSPTEEQLLELALGADVGEMSPVETVRAVMSNDGYVIFDSGSTGVDAEVLDFHPPPGPCTIRSYVIKDDAKEVGFVLHTFTR